LPGREPTVQTLREDSKEFVLIKLCVRKKFLNRFRQSVTEFGWMTLDDSR
jgi:hypothetical protein